jgi:cysteinyl-tRNA synthetase
LWDIVRDEKMTADLRRAAAARADEILGLNLLTPDEEALCETFSGEKGTAVKLTVGRPLADAEKQEIVEKVRQRQRARAAKDWGEADRFRRELSALGATVKDRPDGTADVVIQ